VAPHRFVDTEAELAWVVEQLLVQPRYALDTEFHRERTYWPKVALVQIAWPGELVLIDPLAVDLAPLRALMDSDALAVLHAASQDLEVLELATGAVPRRLFDTQIAAGFLGMSTPSLASLHERELGVQLPKGNRLTDWLERPLKPAQKEYAAADVERLLDEAPTLRCRYLGSQAKLSGELQGLLDGGELVVKVHLLAVRGESGERLLLNLVTV